jgi:hypothetical protein
MKKIIYIDDVPGRPDVTYEGDVVFIMVAKEDEEGLTDVHFMVNGTGESLLTGINHGITAILKGE